MQKNPILKVDYSLINVLNPYEKKLLCFYAYIGDEVIENHLVLFSSSQQKHNINPDESVKKLVNLSFLTLIGRQGNIHIRFPSNPISPYYTS